MYTETAMTPDNEKTTSVDVDFCKTDRNEA
jgi:hypothetical protein